MQTNTCIEVLSGILNYLQNAKIYASQTNAIHKLVTAE